MWYRQTKTTKKNDYKQKRTDIAKTSTIAIPWTHSPVASKLEVALQGNPSPTSSLRPLRTLRVARSSNWDPHGLLCQHSIQSRNRFLSFAYACSFFVIVISFIRTYKLRSRCRQSRRCSSILQHRHTKGLGNLADGSFRKFAILYNLRYWFPFFQHIRCYSLVQFLFCFRMVLGID